MMRSMTKPEIKWTLTGRVAKRARGTRRAVRGLLVLALAVGIAALPAVRAAPLPERQAVEIDERLSVDGGRALLTDTATGAWAATDADADAAWRALKDVLGRLGIAVESEDAARRELTTGWVRWKVDPKTGKAMSRLELFQRVVATPLMEDHRFRFRVEASASGTRLAIADHARVEEYKFSDDPDYTWIKWREAPPDPRAARTFLKHILGAYEAALSTRIVEVPAAGQAPVTLVVAAPPSDAPVSIVSVPKSPPSATMQPPTVRTAPPVAVLPPAVPTPPAQLVPVPQPAETAYVAQRPAAAPPVAVRASAPQSARAAERLGNALLVRARPEQTWNALLEAARAMEIPFARQDAAAHTAVSDWIDYRYNERKDRFERNPDESQKLVFGFSGPQKQRHRFQFQLSPGNEPDTTLVHVAHLNWEAQDFRTPGGGGDLALVWKVRAPGSEAALAFLRLLSTRLYIGQ